MSENNLTIWCNNSFRAEHADALDALRRGTSAHQLLRFAPTENGAAGESREALLSADIAFGQPAVETVLENRNLRWIHLNSAGYAAYDREDLRQFPNAQNAVLTNSSAVFDEPCAQHLLAMMLALARNLPDALDAQRNNRAWRNLEIRRESRLLNEQTVVILGFGAIARRLVELLRPLEMRVIGVRRNPRGDEPIKTVAQADLDAVLPLADHVVNILPGTGETHDFLSRARLAKLKPGARVYNIGRGTTVDQTALIENLHNGRIAAAYLDVTEPEPLPADDPLWSAPNCFVTPHTAGGFDQEKRRQVEHFLDNLTRFERGAELINRIF